MTWELSIPRRPRDATDAPLFAFDKKARDSNRLPARVLEKDWIRKVSTGNVQIVDDFGNPATLQKDVPVEIDDDEPVELSKELLAEIEKISGYNARAAWSSVRRSLTKSVAQPLAKRANTFKAAPSFGACTCAEEGRKCLACREKNVSRVVEQGNGRTIYWENGETYEPIESR